MKQVARIIDEFNEWLGTITSWLALAMVLMMCLNVGMRYIFSSGDPWQAEVVRFMHGILFLAGASYALKHEALVRVDVIYQSLGPRKEAVVNIIGTVVFLFPMCAAIVWFSADFILGSWEIYEGSSEYKGMPGVFVFKSFIWVMAFTLALQGISSIIHNIGVIRGEEPIQPYERGH